MNKKLWKNRKENLKRCLKVEDFDYDKIWNAEESRKHMVEMEKVNKNNEEKFDYTFEGFINGEIEDD